MIFSCSCKADVLKTIAILLFSDATTVDTKFRRYIQETKQVVEETAATAVEDANNVLCDQPKRKRYRLKLCYI